MRWLAGEAEAAYRYSVQAGDEALAVFAVEDAIGHYEQARSLLQEHQPLQTMLPASEVEHLYVYLGQAYAFQNAWQQAQEAYEELLAYAQQHQLPALVSMTLNRLAILALQQSNDKPKVQALLEEAWQMARDQSRSAGAGGNGVEPGTDHGRCVGGAKERPASWRAGALPGTRNTGPGTGSQKSRLTWMDPSSCRRL